MKRRDINRRKQQERKISVYYEISVCYDVHYFARCSVSSAPNELKFLLKIGLMVHHLRKKFQLCRLRFHRDSQLRVCQIFRPLRLARPYSVLQKLQVSLAWIFSRSLYFILFIIRLGKKLGILLILCLSVVEKTHFSAPAAKWPKNGQKLGRALSFWLQKVHFHVKRT